MLGRSKKKDATNDKGLENGMFAYACMFVCVCGGGGQFLNIRKLVGGFKG